MGMSVLFIHLEHGCSDRQMHFCGRVGHQINRYDVFQGVPDRPTGKGTLGARQSAGK
jgi:hypothetical protein